MNNNDKDKFLFLFWKLQILYILFRNIINHKVLAVLDFFPPSYCLRESAYKKRSFGEINLFLNVIYCISSSCLRIK